MGRVLLLLGEFFPLMKELPLELFFDSVLLLVLLLVFLCLLHEANQVLHDLILKILLGEDSLLVFLFEPAEEFLLSFFLHVSKVFPHL